jgi:hypothetical protein
MQVDVLPCSWGMLVTLKVTKTLQFRSKSIEIVLPVLHGHPLCPYNALSRVLTIPGGPLDPLFCLSDHYLFIYYYILILIETSALEPSPRFLCRPTALYILLEPWDVRELSIRKTADLLLQLWVSTFPRFVAIGFLFSIRNPYINRFTNHFSIHS